MFIKLADSLISCLNRHPKLIKRLGWFIQVLVVIQSVLMWAAGKEFETYTDCLFHNRKQAKHPWIKERTIEYPWVYKRVSNLNNCRILDVGAKEGLPITDLLLENHNYVYAIDINTSGTRKTGNLSFVKGDIVSTSFEDNFFDAVILVSTLEHIGVAGRYGVTQQDEEGDFRAMRESYRILKPGGRVIVTVPYGVGKSLPLNRLYNAERIKRIFDGFEINESQYFKFNSTYQLWLDVPETVAAGNNWDNDQWYAIACFDARKSASGRAQ